MIVVSDASSLIALAMVGRLDLLRSLFGMVIIPHAVFGELSRSSFHVASAIQSSSWIQVKHSSDEELVRKLQSNLDKGESEAIALAIELLIIDERKGRNEATRLGLRIIGLIGVLPEGKRAGYIQSVKPLLDTVIETVGFRVSKEVYARALESVGESL